MNLKAEISVPCSARSPLPGRFRRHAQTVKDENAGPSCDKFSGCSISAAAEQQKLVDAYFQSAAPCWKEIYQLDDIYATIHQQRRAAVLALVDKLGWSPESHILEIGCGAGSTTVALAQRGYVVEAIDTVGAMIDLTRQAAVETGVGHRVRTSVGDVRYLAFPDNMFSLVVAMGVTPYLYSLSQAMHEMARVLKPGGYLTVNADNTWRLNDVLDPRRFPALASTRWKVREVLERFGLCKPASRPRPHMYSIKEFDAFLSTVGLEKVEGTTLGFGPFSFLNYKLLPDSVGVKLHHKLQSLADRGFPLIRSTGAQYIVLARKFGADQAC